MSGKAVMHQCGYRLVEDQDWHGVLSGEQVSISTPAHARLGQGWTRFTSYITGKPTNFHRIQPI